MGEAAGNVVREEPTFEEVAHERCVSEMVTLVGNRRGTPHESEYRHEREEQHATRSHDSLCLHHDERAIRFVGKVVEGAEDEGGVERLVIPSRQVSRVDLHDLLDER